MNHCRSLILLITVILISCQEQSFKDKYLGLKFNLPEYYNEYDLLEYEKEGKIIITYDYKKSENFLHFKDSLDQNFIDLKKNGNYDKSSPDYLEGSRLREKISEIMSDYMIPEIEQLNPKWHSKIIDKKGGYLYTMLDYETNNRHNIEFVWYMENYSVEHTFWTENPTEEKINDVRKMIKEMKLSEE